MTRSSIKVEYKTMTLITCDSWQKKLLRVKISRKFSNTPFVGNQTTFALPLILSLREDQTYLVKLTFHERKVKSTETSPLVLSTLVNN